jgi:hypothetical protein
VTARQATVCAIAEARRFNRIPMTQRFRYLKLGRLPLSSGPRNRGDVLDRTRKSGLHSSLAYRLPALWYVAVTKAALCNRVCRAVPLRERNIQLRAGLRMQPPKNALHHDGRASAKVGRTRSEGLRIRARRSAGRRSRGCRFARRAR